MTKINWAKLSKQSIEERWQTLQTFDLLNKAHLKALIKHEQLSLETANQMAENVISTLSLPFSLVPDVLVDGIVYTVPYVTEEPSVVAASSYAAKLVKHFGGISTKINNRQMIGQIALYYISDFEQASKKILAAKESLLELANQAYPSIVKRGGGARDLRVEQIADFLIIYVTVDTQEAMGANMVNTMMEALKPSLCQLSGGSSLMAILSNYATESLVTAQCRLPYRVLSRKPSEAKTLAEKLALASQLAQVDPYRASTHNKGIFNGIDALMLATGNDWRAIEAGGHAYASRDGHYRGLSTWEIDPETEEIIGQLTLPMPVATKGGSIGLNPSVAIACDLLNSPTAKELASLTVAMGLLQNFAALKALISTGIQAGHMKLQAKALALQAGALEDELGQVLPQLLKAKPFNLEKAKQIITAIRQKSS